MLCNPAAPVGMPSENGGNENGGNENGGNENGGGNEGGGSCGGGGGDLVLEMTLVHFENDKHAFDMKTSGG